VVGGVAAAVVALALVAVLPPAVASDAPGTSRVSVASDGAQANATSGLSRLSADGRFVAFQSFAANLVPGDTNGQYDAFVHDRKTQETIRVSVSEDGSEARGYQYIQSLAISGDGRVVAFQSSASDLVAGDTNAADDIFVHQIDTGETTRVSVSSEGTQGNGPVLGVALNDDGRFVAFTSGATNLVPGDTNGDMDVFVHDRKTGETTRVSVASDGSQARGGGGGYEVSLSGDGGFVAFASGSDDLVPDDRNGRVDVFVHDRKTDEMSLVSRRSDGTQGDESSWAPAISGDGRYVAFESSARNLGGDVDPDPWMDIFVHDRKTGRTTPVSVSADGERGNWNSYSATVSAGGRYIGFMSDANNVVPGDTNDARDAFVFDLRTRRPTRVSASWAGVEGNAHSFRPSIDRAGRVVVFASVASNLVPGDTNDSGDVFVRLL
jgi:Tol biopolymer transport system component